MLKKLAVYDLAKYIFTIPLIFLLVHQYIITGSLIIKNVLIVYSITCICYEALTRTWKRSNKNVAACREEELVSKAGPESKEIEWILLKNQTKLLNEALKNTMDMNSELGNRLKEKEEELEVLREASGFISSTFDINTLVEYIYKIFNKFTKCDRYIICFVDKEHNKLICKYEYGNYTCNNIGKVMGEDSTTITRCFKSKETSVRINVAMKERDIFGDKLALPLNVSGELEGVIYIESSIPGSFLDINIKFLESISNNFAVALKTAELFNDIVNQKQEIEALYEEAAAVNEELNSYITSLNNAQEELRIKNEELIAINNEIHTGYLKTVMALANSIEANDSYTRGHCQRVMEISCELAKKMGYEDHEVEDLRYAAILHDIGKIGISASILNKEGKLTEEEFDEIKKHPFIAYNILKDVDFIKDGLSAILQHHERYDGRGYPNKLKGEQLSVFGRILCIADAFDAMTSDRPYRQGMPVSDAIEEIERCKGTQFDPCIADIFIKMNAELKSI